MSMQPSLATMKTSTECKKALHLREIERSHRQVARKRRHGSKMQGRKWEPFISFPLTASPLTFTFTYHSKSRGCSQSSIKIRAIYVLSNVPYGSMSPFSTKNPHIHVVQRHPSVPSHGILFNLVTLTCFSPLLHLLSLITNSDTVI